MPKTGTGTRMPQAQGSFGILAMDFGGRQQTCVSSRVKLSDLVGVHPCLPSQPGPNDIFTAIFRPKKSFAATDDNSVATLNPNTMEILGLFRGDTIYCLSIDMFSFLVLHGKKRRDTVLICLSSDDVEEGRIQVNKVACNNLRVKLGDLVGVHSCLDIKYGKRSYPTVRRLGRRPEREHFRSYRSVFEITRPLRGGDEVCASFGVGPGHPAFSQNLQQSRGFRNNFKFPKGEGGSSSVPAASTGNAGFTEDTADDNLYA
ncbi:hypothetical protein B0H13DRAFT_1874010 [Mycena leptocephala]|nr:hypothetical protein B0H13DRAFT_1874010 [Mycena leptocephala]